MIILRRIFTCDPDKYADFKTLFKFEETSTQKEYRGKILDEYKLNFIHMLLKIIKDVNLSNFVYDAITLNYDE